MFAKQLSIVAMGLFAVGGCMLDAGIDDPAADDATTKVQSALFYTWSDAASPPRYSNLTKAAAYANGKMHIFYSDASACKGSTTRVCESGSYAYSVPGNVYKYLRGVGVLGTQFVAWYEHGYYSMGDATNLGSVQGMTAFSAAPFKASQMIDAVNIPSTSQWDVFGGRWAFYWRDEANPNLVWRTVGKVSDADYYEGQKQVQVANYADYGAIVGIDFIKSTGGPTPASPIYTYYAKGSVNRSVLPLNLRSLD